MNLRTEFTDRDDFANYVIGELLSHGMFATDASNLIMKTKFVYSGFVWEPAVLINYVIHDKTMEYPEFTKNTTLVYFLYDIYNQHYAKPKKEPIKIKEEKSTNVDADFAIKNGHQWRYFKLDIGAGSKPVTISAKTLISILRPENVYFKELPLVTLDEMSSTRAKDFGRWLLANFETKTDFGDYWLFKETGVVYMTTEQAYELFLKSEQ